MKIGVPKERKVMEGRVGLTPDACAELIKLDHQLFIESDAGLLSGYCDDDYAKVGVSIVETAEQLYAESVLIVKVKEPIESDLRYIKSHHVLFCFLHLAANQALAEQLCLSGCTAIAFESVENNKHHRIILAPMSQIAGRLSVQIGTTLLHQPNGGRGVLLGGVSNADKGHVVVLGAGVAGEQAACLAANMGAQVTLFDINTEKLARIQQAHKQITTQYAYEHAIEEALVKADLVVGAVLIPDKHAPKIVTEDMIKSMPARSVIVDIAIDQGGCVETMRPTNYEEPTFIQHDVIHFGVTNMPGAVPRTASQALSSAITPSVQKIASLTWQTDEFLSKAVNIESGKVVLPALIEEFGLTKRD